jgi:hypothetical protein
MCAAAVTAAEAQCDDCAFGVDLVVTSARDTYERGGRVVYSLTVRNQGSKDIRDVVLWTSDGAHSPPYEIEDGLGRAAENRGWNQQGSTPATDYNYEVWERFLGLLHPGQAVTVPFCVEIPAKDPNPFSSICLDLVKYFWVNGHPRGVDSGGLGPKLDTALVRHLPSGCAAGGMPFR